MSKKARKIKALHEELKQPLFWEMKEHEPKDRHWRWYAIAGAIALGLVVWGMLTQNFLFSLIIVLAGFIIYTLDHQEPLPVRIELKKNGLDVNGRLYEYHRFHSFFIVYKPDQGVKNLYLEFKGMRPRFSIPLGNVNPILVRDYLLKYIDEDLERTGQPISEGLAKFLQL